MSHQRDRAADAPGRRRHATKRRRPGPRRLLAGAGIVGLGLLAAVVSGAFRSGQTGGAPTGDDGRPGMPSLIQADPSGDGEAGATGTPAPSSSAAPGSASPSVSASASASASARESASATGAAAPPATGDSGSDGPGKSGSAPGQTKRPR
ncbi:hypothetical protein ACFUJR_18455 [Streptomyces sp. NPDC057271]|uniref:hypothetical protein n=1 Tax=unclassified Streptomyces TaxID=2593676 RepID=UPI003626B9EC